MDDMEAEDRADAIYRAANVNALQRKLIMKLAETEDHTLELIGERAWNKTWVSLEDNGWTRSQTNGWTGSDCVITVQFTLAGWEAMCILVDEDEAKVAA